MFGGSAWEYDQATGEYYYHMFAREQPDLNFNNPEVRQAQLEVLRSWLERGVDGFRLDVFNAYFEHLELPDNPRSPLGRLGLPFQQHIQDADQPSLIPFLGELRALVDRYPGRFLVGETMGGPEAAARYVGDHMLHAAFSFDFSDLQWRFPFGVAQGGRFHPSYFMERTIRRESLFSAAQGWPTNVFSNHDVPRAAGRYARGGDDDGPARLAMALLLTLRGTPFMYQGEEIAMRDVRLGRREIMDPAGRPYWPLYKGRDGPRSPFQWSAAPNAGFTAGTPWLKVHPDYRSRNLAAQKADPESFFYFTHRLIALRQIHPALQQGDFVPLSATREVLAYQRKTEHETLTVLLNFARRPTPLRLPLAEHLGGEKTEARVLYSTDRAEGVITGSIVLAPQEVCIIGRGGDR